MNSFNRTERQAGWDSGVLAAAELVRHLMDYDESLALHIHGLLTDKLPETKP